MCEPFSYPVFFDRLFALLDAPTIDHWRLFKLAHTDGCILNFAWSDWLREVDRPLDEPGWIESADLDTCRRVLTVLVRSERFCENSLQAACEEGLVGRVIRRIKELNPPGLDPAPACPKCGSGETAHIFLDHDDGGGLPPFCVWRRDTSSYPSPEAKAYGCNACGHDWGEHPNLTREKARWAARDAGRKVSDA